MAYSTSQRRHDLRLGANFAWTDARIAEAKRLYIDMEWPAGKIADHFGDGATRNAVMGKLNRLGVLRNPKQAREMRRLGAVAGGAASGKIRKEQAEAKRALASTEKVANDRRADIRRARPTSPTPVIGKPLIQFGFQPSFAAPGETPVEIGPGECLYPLNDPPRGWMEETIFCAVAVEAGGQPYCPYHARLCAAPKGAVSEFVPRPGQGSRVRRGLGQ